MQHLLKSIDDRPDYQVVEDTTAEDLFEAGVDLFAFHAGNYCNGPKCVRCHKAVCHHHHKNWWKEECVARMP